jgi:hypothetical protein
VIVDEAIPPMGQCYYELFPFEVSGLGSLADTLIAQNLAADEFSAANSAASADEAADDTTAIEDLPSPRKSAFKQKKGPGGGIITVP